MILTIYLRANTDIPEMLLEYEPEKAAEDAVQVHTQSITLLEKLVFCSTVISITIDKEQHDYPQNNGEIDGNHGRLPG